jgi:hypothetical protein
MHKITTRTKNAGGSAPSLRATTFTVKRKIKT